NDGATKSERRKAEAVRVGRLPFANLTHLELGARGQAEIHAARHSWAKRALLSGGCVLAGVLLPGMLVPPLWVFTLLWFGNGGGQALIAIPSSTLLAEHTSTTDRGRAYAAHFALTHACWLITYPAAGWAGATWGPALAFSAFGLGCIATTTMAYALGGGDSSPHKHVSNNEGSR
ncbi:MAG: MFS transporter, partial [Acidobacteriota bacterium]